MFFTVADCKEKWRNIRSTFLRSMKIPPSGSKPKKPYYLKDVLEFILPYVKPLNESQKPGNIPPAEEGDNSSQAGVQEEQATSDSIEEIPTETRDDSALEGSSTSSIIQSHGTRRRRKNNVDDNMNVFLKRKIEKQDVAKNYTKNQSMMNHFFLSILPEFDDMSIQQMRSFKIKVLELLENIKDETQSMPSTSASSHSYSNLSAYSPISSVATPAAASYPYTSPTNETQETAINFSQNDWLTQYQQQEM